MIDDDSYMKNKMWSAASFLSFDKIEDAYFTKLVNSRAPNFDKSNHILEIGFGNGNLLGWLRHQGISALHGVEINKILLSTAEEHNLFAYSNIEDALSAGPFDIIFALDVIEHLKKDDLINLFQLLSRALRDDDVIILRFPNGDSPFGRINQNGDLTHEMEIGVGNLRMLCQLSQLEIVALTDEPLPIFGVGLLRGLQHLAILSLRKVFQAIFGAVFFQGNFLPLGPNYICSLRKKRMNT